MIDPDYEDMKKLVATQVCAQCGGELTIRTNPEKGGELEVGCPHHPDHRGYVERETYTQAFRRGAEVHPAIRSAIESKMVPKDELGRAMNLLALRYPTAIVDPPTAALFIMDCTRLDIDPLISPAEAVPVPFKSKKRNAAGIVIEEKTTITMVITEDGWLSMAARGCRDDYTGPPKTMRLEEYLTTLPENKGKSSDEIEKIARAIKKSDCSDPEAWYYVAIGKRRGGDDTVVPGWFTHQDHEKATKGSLPAATQPGNQARVRAIKKWVRKVFPECRQKMIELTAEWYQRAEGMKAAQKYIDAEYSFISFPEGGEKIGENAKKSKQKIGQKSAAEESRAGETNLSPPQGKETKKTPEASAAEPAAEEQEGFVIDPIWLAEALKDLKWSTDTTKTFLVSQYKVSPEGTLEEVIKRLTRDQAEAFVKTIQEKVAQKQMDLFP